MYRWVCDGLNFTVSFSLLAVRTSLSRQSSRTDFTTRATASQCMVTEPLVLFFIVHSFVSRTLTNSLAFIQLENSARCAVREGWSGPNWVGRQCCLTSGSSVFTLYLCLFRKPHGLLPKKVWSREPVGCVQLIRI